MPSISKHGRRYSSVEDKLLTSIRFPDDVYECWLWVGKRQRSGHGKFWWRGDETSAHRAMYKTFTAANIDGLDVDHLCRNPPCVNLLHLEAVTRRENTLRGVSAAAVNARKTRCVEGHEFAGSNLIRYRGQRFCRICKNAAWRRSYHRRKGGL